MASSATVAWPVVAAQYRSACGQEAGIVDDPRCLSFDLLRAI